MDRTTVTQSPRLAGEVLRYHTWPTIRQQSVAEHSWQVMRIWRETFQMPMPQDVADYILYHDIAEVQTGDIPFPMKALNPTLKAEMDRLEGESLNSMGIEMPDLNPTAKACIKFCDIVEMMEFGVQEVKMGNRYSAPIIEHTHDAALSIAESIENEYLQHACLRTLSRVKKEMSDG